MPPPVSQLHFQVPKLAARLPQRGEEAGAGLVVLGQRRLLADLQRVLGAAVHRLREEHELLQVDSRC